MVLLVLVVLNTDLVTVSLLETFVFDRRTVKEDTMMNHSTVLSWTGAILPLALSFIQLLPEMNINLVF